MGQPSSQASYALIYLTYGAFLVFGCAIAWRLRKQTKGEFLASNRTQTGQAYIALFSACADDGDAAIPKENIPSVCAQANASPAGPLAMNFVASALGSGILFAYPQLATIAGVQGLIVYAFSSAAPLLIFAFLGPIIRRKCPEGFVLTEWTRQRYGIPAAIFLSFCTLVTMFLYMVAELSAMQQIVTELSGLDGLPVIIVQAVVTTIYTSFGGFKISFITDTIQAVMVLLLVVIATITIGVKTKVDRTLIDESQLLKPSLLGWQLIYILPVAVLTNDFFLSQFWIRTFASKTDKDLYLGVSLAAGTVLIILTLVGVTGLLAVWTGALPIGEDGSIAFFILLETLPNWVVGLVLVMTVALSTAAFDSIQSAMVSTASNDLFRNRLNIWFIRGAIVALIFPVVVIALKAPSILQIYLICDLVSASTIPVLVIGLSDRFYMWRGFEVVVGGLGGILTVFIFGTIYYGNAEAGGKLILLQDGLYANDWSVFGAFVAAPVGGILCGIGAFIVRVSALKLYSIVKKAPFTALDKPDYLTRPRMVNGNEYANEGEVVVDTGEGIVINHHKGKFF